MLSNLSTLWSKRVDIGRVGMKQDELADAVRDGLFQAASRTYAEQYLEPIIRTKFDLRPPTAGDHDAIDKHGKRIEIKTSKVLKTRDNRVGSRSLLNRVLFEAESTPLSRYFDSEHRYVTDYDANIQNVKRDHFDYLIYALLFKDTIMIFQANTEEIQKGKFSNWSDKHGRYDQEGKSGQFPISKTNIKWHEDRFLQCVLPYREVASILDVIS
jgi:hypothetical protein